MCGQGKACAGNRKTDQANIQSRQAVQAESPTREGQLLAVVYDVLPGVRSRVKSAIRFLTTNAHRLGSGRDGEQQLTSHGSIPTATGRQHV